MSECTYMTTSWQVVDKFNDRFISAFVTATHMRLVLLHDGKSEETVRSFFNEVRSLHLALSSLLLPPPCPTLIL